MGVIIQAFYWNCPGNEGQDSNWWNFLNGKVNDLQDAGFTALWLPPATKAADAQSMGYDPYDFYDLGDFDQKGGTKTWFGNKSELVNLIATAHSAGNMRPPILLRVVSASGRWHMCPRNGNQRSMRHMARARNCSVGGI